MTIEFSWQSGCSSSESSLVSVDRREPDHRVS